MAGGPRRTSRAVGWAIGDGKEHGDDPSWDAAEADALYGLLEGEVAQAFYTRDEHGIPQGWVARMRESMARLTSRFSANRAVREYTDTHYLPAAAAYRERAANGSRQGGELVAWRKDSNGAGVRRVSRPSTFEQMKSGTRSVCTSTWASSTPRRCAWNCTLTG